MATNRFACDPALTGNLNAEYDALQNDLEQAKLLAADYQGQLSDKSNAVATLKLTLEKTQADLAKLQCHIVALREERHRLANEVMKVVALEAKVARLTDEVTQLRALPGMPRRDFIEVGLDDPASLTIIPTPVEPRPVQDPLMRALNRALFPG